MSKNIQLNHGSDKALGPFWGLLVQLSLLAMVCMTGARPALADPPRFELIYTQPLETALAQPLRAPAPVWVELFATAQKTIDIEQFYIAEQKGEVLDSVLAALEAAARRGVQVRMLVDAKMRKQSQPTLDRMATWPNTQVRVIDWGKVDPRNGRKPGGIIHAKFMVIDRQVAYVGSQNFDWRSLSHVHELGVLVRDSRICAQMQAIVDHDWSAAGLQVAGQPVPVLQPTVRQAPEITEPGYLVASPPEWLPKGVGASEDELVRLISMAKKRLQIQVMKYEPLDHHKRYYGPVDAALRAAAARGVDVELLVSDWNADAPGIHWLQSLVPVPHVQVKMVTLPPAQRGFIPYARVIHSKYMVVDGQTLWIGTSNWQGGYFDESRNLELVLPLPDLAAQAAAVHDQLWKSPYAKGLDATRAYPRVKRD